MMFLLLIVAPVIVYAYEHKYDHVDIEAILNNRRMVNYYTACLVSHGPCTPQGAELKRILPEAIETNCAKCTEKQKAAGYRAIRRLQKEYPKVWIQLKNVWDPKDIYVRKFLSTFENSNNQPPVIANRFGEETTKENNYIATNTIAASLPSDSANTNIASTSTIITTIIIPAKTTTQKPIVQLPSINHNSANTNNIFITRPAPPLSNFQATVSFGTNLVGGIVRSLGQLGTKVIQSGTQLANVVLGKAFKN